MRFSLALIVALVLAAQPALARVIKIYTFNGKSSRQNSAERDCLDSIPLGCISFKTAQTWIVESGDSISQEWSDVVVATGCNKDTYNGGTVSSYNADCRENPGYGNLLSWEMVNAYKNKLCPDAWRVPTRDDFDSLYTALGATLIDSATVSNRWGVSYGGACLSDGHLDYQRTSAYYWSQTECNAHSGYSNLTSLEVAESNMVSAWGVSEKTRGFMLRCVKSHR